MVGLIPFGDAETILTRLRSLDVEEIGFVHGGIEDLKMLGEKLATIKGVLVDAEEKQKENDAVKALEWGFTGVLYNVEDVLDDFATHQLQRRAVATKVSDFFSSSNQLVFPSQKLKDVAEKVDEIVKEIHRLNLIQGNLIHGEVESSQGAVSVSSEIVGIEEDKGEIIKSLVSSDTEEILSMVAILGVGGVGKTTLARLVYNDDKVAQFFEIRTWLCVSDNFDAESLVLKILKQVCEEDAEKLGLDALNTLLCEKRCLFVLDNVWNDNPEKFVDGCEQRE